MRLPKRLPSLADSSPALPKPDFDDQVRRTLDFLPGDDPEPLVRDEEAVRLDGQVPQRHAVRSQRSVGSSNGRLEGANAPLEGSNVSSKLPMSRWKVPTSRRKVPTRHWKVPTVRRKLRCPVGGSQRFAVRFQCSVEAPTARQKVPTLRWRVPTVRRKPRCPVVRPQRSVGKRQRHVGW